MILTPGELIARCEECVRTYDPSRTTVDSHTDEYVTRKRISDPDDERFVQQVMYGTFRYKKMLKIFLSSLYFKHGGETQRSDYTLYMVFGYLALLRLHELGFSDFRTLVLSPPRSSCVEARIGMGGTVCLGPPESASFSFWHALGVFVVADPWCQNHTVRFHP